MDARTTFDLARDGQHLDVFLVAFVIDGAGNRVGDAHATLLFSPLPDGGWTARVASVAGTEPIEIVGNRTTSPLGLFDAVLARGRGG